MPDERYSHHSAVRFSDNDWERVENLADYWGCSLSDAIRTSVRIADALAKEVGYARITKFSKLKG